MTKFLIYLITAGLMLVLSGSQSLTCQPGSCNTMNENISQKNSLLQSAQNLNPAAFKNMGDLVFVWQGLLYVLDGTTGELKQLTHSGQARHPAWSPDGEWLAFIFTNGPDDNSSQLWLMRLDGGEAHQIPGQSFSWANQKIEISESLSATSASAHACLTGTSASQAGSSLSPASDVLAVSGTDGLWLVPVDRTPHLVVKGSVSPPVWSPDGKFIAYSVTLPFDKNNPESRSDALYTLNLSTGETVEQITAHGAGIQVAAWWPDGEGILYWLDPMHSASLAADGLPLYSFRSGVAEPALLSTGLGHTGWQVFSPQGQLLIVSGVGRQVWSEKNLTVINPGSGKTEKLPNPNGLVALDPSFSPDGSKITFAAAQDLGAAMGFSDPDKLTNWIATRTLWIENADGSGAHPIPAGPGVYQPVWSKDGSKIMYVRDNSLWVVGANSENPEKILGPFPDWGKDQFGYYGYIRHDDFAWFQPSSAESAAVNVVKKQLEAEKNNDYEVWKSTLWPPDKNAQNFTPSFEKPCDLGVISLSINQVKVSESETKRMKERYAGSELAQKNGWSDQFIADNLIVVSAQYTVDYDNTKVPYQEGTLSRDFILIRNGVDSPWLIWDATSASVIKTIPAEMR